MPVVVGAFWANQLTLFFPLITMIKGSTFTNEILKAYRAVMLKLYFS